MRTDVGQIIGTLQYMSPEQCGSDPHDVDTRSDVYALGVVLYELLCGQLPYDLTGSAIHVAARAICEKPPARPGELDRRLRGDVEMILFKALHKDREERYQSAAGLAADIRRYLNREPISARPPTAWTRTTRWIARHPLAATTAACLAVVALTIAATFIIVRWVNERPYEMFLPKLPGQASVPGGYEARLLAATGNIIKTWAGYHPDGAGHGVGIAELVKRPAKLGGGRVILLGYLQSNNLALSGALFALDADGDLEKPLWVRRVTTADILPTLREDRGYVREDFNFKYGRAIDIFPERSFPERPGREIVAVFGHRGNSQRVLRIYDLTGELLYQVWYDGSIGGPRWLADAGLLLFPGDFHLPFWSEDGELIGKKGKEPVVVFALRPKPGFIGEAFLVPRPEGASNDPLSPVWFRCVRPPDAAASVTGLRLLEPRQPHDPLSYALLCCAFGANRSIVVSWLLDKTGAEVPDTRGTSDQYKENLNLPDGDPDKLDLPDWLELKLVPYDTSREPPRADKPSATTERGGP